MYDLSRTPTGLTDDQLIARYQAAEILAEAHFCTVGDILADWSGPQLDLISILAGRHFEAAP